MLLQLSSRAVSRYGLFTDDNVRHFYQSLLRGTEGASEEWQQLYTDAAYEVRVGPSPERAHV